MTRTVSPLGPVMVPKPRTSSGTPKGSFDWDHILDGANKPRRKGGFHSRPGGVDPPNATLVSKGPADGAGVYEGVVKITDPVTGKVTTKPRSFFPDSWSRERVKFEVEGAFEKRTILDPSKPDKWTGISPSGVRIQGYGQEAAFPVRYGRK